MTATTVAVVCPIVHLNGTSAEKLSQVRQDAYYAIQQAYDSLKQTAPNGRDYYLEPGRLEKATAQHMRRLSLLDQILAELEAEIGEIESQTV